MSMFPWIEDKLTGPLSPMPGCVKAKATLVSRSPSSAARSAWRVHTFVGCRGQPPPPGPFGVQGYFMDVVSFRRCINGVSKVAMLDMP